MFDLPIYIVDLNHAQCKRYVDNNKYEKKHYNVQNHVRHTDDNWTSLAPHQTYRELEETKV